MKRLFKHQEEDGLRGLGLHAVGGGLKARGSNLNTPSLYLAVILKPKYCF